MSGTERFLDRLQKGERLLADGAWGTQLNKLGLEDGECPEEWNVSRPDDIGGLARRYAEAGADIGLTNTYGGNKFRLKRHGLAGRVKEINLAGARVCRAVADEFGRFLAGCVGPSGELLEPKGLASRDEMYDAFHSQIEALKEGGVDGVVVETFSGLDEIELPIRAAKDLGLFCMATMTFDHAGTGFQSTAGVTPEVAARELEGFGADVIGTNCGHGIRDMAKIVGEMRPHTRKPILIQSNAGLPKLVNGEEVYGESPEWMAERVKELVEAGANIIGGCCGTTPDHIRSFRAALDKL